MNRAIIIGYFSSDFLLQEFYNLLSVELRRQSFELTGIHLAETPSDGYIFPIKYLGSPSLAPATTSRLYGFLHKISCYVPGGKKAGKLRSYAEMQAQTKNRQSVEKEILNLNFFQQKLEEYCRSGEVTLVILNHQFSGNHLIARQVCDHMSIPFVYWHPGFLPGTMSFDREGQLAESEINTRLRNELLACGEEQLALGRLYQSWVSKGDYLRPGKSSSSDPASLVELKQVARNFIRVALVIGSNDYRAGIRPESYVCSRLHSPTYRSSDAFLQAVIANTDESTLVLFKPHPNLSDAPQGLTMTSGRTGVITDVTIRDLLPLVDFTATICSTAAYESLLMEKPTILAGRLPGSELGIFHVVCSKKPLKDVIDVVCAGKQACERARLFHLFIGYMLTRYFFAAGSAACPLVKRNLGTALEELLN